MESIIIERIYNAPIELVWRAITERELMKQWYFDFAEDFKPEVGAWFEWHGGEPGGKQWLHRGKMIEVVKEKKLIHTWEYPGYIGISTITWQLTAVDKENTKLNFSQVFTVPFDPNESALKRENFNGGWNHIINIGLLEFLSKK